MVDLTIIFLTVNEVPEHWAAYQTAVLKSAAGPYPIISISAKPMNIGENLIQTEKKSYWNIYRQLLRGARLAKTDFVALAEDDTLYTSEHFREFRPPKDAVSYDRSRWSLFTWEKKPMYCLRNRVTNTTMIAPREYLIDAIEEREKRWPNGYKYDYAVGEVGREIVEKNLDVSRRNKVEWYCSNPVINICHANGTDERSKDKWKKHGQIKAYDIPFFGPAKGIVDIYNNTKPINKGA